MGKVNSIKTLFLLKLVLKQKLKERMLLLNQKALTYTVLVLQKEGNELQKIQCLPLMFLSTHS